MIDRSEQSAARLTLQESRVQDDAFHGTPEQRWNLMWELALQGWVLQGNSEDEFIQSRLRRDVECVIRRRS